MTKEIKEKVREVLATNYDKDFLETCELKYIKKEIYHTIKNFTKGDKRETKFY
tara:strand:- start:9460 stop:9618 length:159 start_codon:yes stop_codon:yes gene_type:complete